MADVEHKQGTLKAVAGEGKATVRLARLMRTDLDADVIEPGFFPTSPLTASLQGFHKHDEHSLGHVRAWEDTARGEILADFEFNDTAMAREIWKSIAWDAAHEPSIQEYSWAFRIRDGASRQGTFEGRSVRFLGKASDGREGVLLIEAGPVLKAASVGTGTLAVRSARDLGLEVENYQRLHRILDKLSAAKAGLQRLEEMERGHRRTRPSHPLVTRFLRLERYACAMR